ncbi:hypothetical protein MTO96_042510 [Rhipicephalus appendiculatus]
MSTKVDDAERQENRISPAEPAPSKLPMPSDTKPRARRNRATGSRSASKCNERALHSRTPHASAGSDTTRSDNTDFCSRYSGQFA